MAGLVRTLPELEAALAQLEAPFVAVDTETSGLDPAKDRVLLIQVGTARAQVLVDAQAVGVPGIERIFARERLVVLHHAKFDLKMLAAMGAGRVLSRAKVADTMLAEQLLRNGRRSELGHGGVALAVLAERHAGMDLDKSVRAEFIGVSSVDQIGEAALGYARRDVEATYKVFQTQLRLLAADGLLRAAAIEGAACFAFAELERHGLGLDVEAWKALIHEAEAGRSAARARLDVAFDAVLSRDLFGAGNLNYDSDAEVLEALKRLGVSVDGTRREVLRATGHPAALALADYREHQRMVSSYGRVFLDHVHPVTGRVHPSFKQIGATTGRSACGEPNLQNIPAESAFRACFVAAPGHRMITADYAGAELRILAEISKDPVFLAAFERGEDLHAAVATRMFHVPVSKSERPELRARAKAINFGLAYGMGAHGLAAQLGVPLPEAEKELERYQRAFPRVAEHLERAASLALRRGYAETLSGRKLWFLDASRQSEDEAARRRLAKNMPIQGTNADMIKVALARICRRFYDEGLDAKVVNMVHDEIVVEAESTIAEHVRDIVVAEMVGAGGEFLKQVPIEVDAVISGAWSK